MNETNQKKINKDLQIIFTTHSEMIMKLDYLIDVKYLFKTDEKTFVLDRPNSDIIYRLSGEMIKKYEIYVEDSLSESIIREIAGDLGIRREISICCFGAASNCFTIAAGLKLKENGEYSNLLFVIDGDEYKTSESKEKKVKKILTGNTDIAEKQREEVLDRIEQYCLPDGMNPEEFLADVFLDISDDSEDVIEIKNAILENKIQSDKHDIINKSLEYLNYDKKTGYSKIINLVKREEAYCEFIANVEEKLRNMVVK